jgi:GNAT superfamily N-acetyltransferase
MRNLPANSRGGGHRYPAPIIKLAERCDIPAMIQVIIDAQSSDVLSWFTYPTEEDKKKIALDMTQELEKIWDSPAARFVKAVDVETGEIASVALWQLKGYNFKNEEGNYELNSLLDSFRLPPRSRDGEKDPRQILGDHIHAKFAEFFASWTDNTKHMYLAVLMTAPRFQRRGYGTALLKWGYKVADREGIPLFLVATPVGHPVYLHQGWKEVNGTLEINMKKWVAGAEGGDRGWGTYTFYYMMRLPMTAEKD